MIPQTSELGGLIPDGGRATEILSLHGDGSSRRFSRVLAESASYVLLEGPDEAENAAYVRIARHLGKRGIRVPKIHAVDARRGWILMEDLGDRSLFRAIRSARAQEEIATFYAPVLDLLVRMQVKGARGYHPSVGFEREPYGVELMIEREGLYFAREFVSGLLGREPSAGYVGDIERLAELGGRAPSRYFLHRDFQSRNLLLTPTGPALIDFQGARHGPLAYDAASLILDPYVGLGRDLRTRLLGEYIRKLRELGAATEAFADAWFALGAFRLLQALGAFAKLGGRMGKPGFLEHAAQGLDTLADHLGERGRREYPAISSTVSECRDAWARQGVAFPNVSSAPHSE